MPDIADFGAFRIKIYFGDHNPPHFHVIAPDFAARVTIDDLAIIDGSLPPGVLRRIHRWAAANTDLLTAKWREYCG
ncbi:MAG: DUF4160 domain-containing protein [Alphaproteobacteria bacterium]